MTLDAVCCMELDEQTAKWRSNYENETYYFCAQGCQAKFDSDPETFIPEAPQPQA